MNSQRNRSHLNSSQKDINRNPGLKQSDKAIPPAQDSATRQYDHLPANVKPVQPFTHINSMGSPQRPSNQNSGSKQVNLNQSPSSRLIPTANIVETNNEPALAQNMSVNGNLSYGGFGGNAKIGGGGSGGGYTSSGVKSLQYQNQLYQYQQSLQTTPAQMRARANGFSGDRLILQGLSISKKDAGPQQNHSSLT